MLTPEFLRLLSLAQLVTPEVVRLGREEDTLATVVQFCNGTLAHAGVPPVTAEEAQDVAEIVCSMLAARFAADRVAPISRLSRTAARLMNAAISAPIRCQVPADRGA
ncbi:hypothetical protein NS228_25210 [Methylobacterium indicum]|uniref:hypothetical protein n=1 Tax=Methylobacterium indicum TaxID=1775910 RepID=UPI000734AA3C|nr:hypothetical protein [Methylobacterium indicum]KTS12884.1 hypothetical protein NS229_29005 [Methylobacterium indicum]KTS27265.1 hypothetical protein NS228_25210 [Methylobacterium indicum]KTS44359.1 hypothetical protein NS230_25535 [Methylobacterium indicum]